MNSTFFADTVSETLLIPLYMRAKKAVAEKRLSSATLSLKDWLSRYHTTIQSSTVQSSAK